MNYIRKNGWIQNIDPSDQSKGNFRNEETYWYAVGVYFLQQIPISEPSSWWFYAAIHGQYLTESAKIKNKSKYLNWDNIAYINQDMIKDFPDESIQKKYWDQCQHGTWYFSAWHRGYLVSLEKLLRDVIVSKGGPEDWALPYWDIVNEKSIPFEFSAEAKFIFEGSELKNPLYVKERYGTGIDNRVNNNCQNTNFFTTINDIIVGYGGGKTNFSHNGKFTGKLESNPHNIGHVEIGSENTDHQSGLMSVPNTAALDPIFYYHHSNIDRLWNSWNKMKNKNPVAENWLNGPASMGDRIFIMPYPNNWEYAPKDVNDVNQVNVQGENYSYNYDNLTKIFKNMEGINNKLSENENNQPELLIATENVNVFNSKVFQPEFSSINNLQLKKSNNIDLNSRYFLLLEGVKGTRDSNIIDVFIKNKLVESIGLFGLSSASEENSHHGGNGLNFSIEITNILKTVNNLNNIIQSVHLQLENDLNKDSLTIDRVSIYKL